MWNYSIESLDSLQKMLNGTLEEAQKSTPTDMFLFQPEEYVRLVDKYRSIFITDDAYMGDIFLANTIPVVDMYLGPANKPDDLARVIIFPSVLTKLNEYKDKNRTVQVGLMIFKINTGAYVAIEINFHTETLQIAPDLRPIPFGPNVHTDLPADQRQLWINTFCSYISAWYAIQLSLLHPQAKICFSHPKRQKIKKDTYSMKKPKEYIHIRRHTLDASAFEEALHTDVGHKKYTCLCWWVTGHYRMQNGKRRFVKGYWKGPLRETKKVENIRQRGIPA